MDLLRFTTAGSVDDGKSTLIGRLLYDSKSIFEDQLEAIEETSKRRGDGHGQGAYGYHYPYPYPVMWVKVPIVAERRDCGCETVVEEWVEEEPAPPRIRRIAPPRDKRIRITK